jgi:hypothetical protein
VSKAESLTKEEVEDQIKLYEKALIICKHDGLKQILQERLKELHDRSTS